MRPATALILAGLVAACTAPPAERSRVVVDGQDYTVTTQAGPDGTLRHRVRVDGRDFDCTAPTPEGCAAAVRHGRAVAIEI